jgi:hypothetical protein
MTKKKKETTVALLGQNDVPTMLEQVNARIKAIKGELPEATHTTSNLPGFGKIAEIKTVDMLIKAASSVLGKEAAYKAAAKEIIPEGIKTPQFKIEGSTAKQWLDDIKNRVVVVGHKEQLTKLNSIKTELEANLSAEAKLANSLAKIKGILTDEE